MINIGVVFGAASTEHEVSLAGAECILEAFEQLDGYNAQPIGIGKTGDWYTGEHALATLISKADDEKLFIKKIEDFEPQDGHTAPPLDYIDGCDYIMSIVLGEHGEDGQIQGFFKTLGKKIIGCDVLANALCFDKAILKATLSDYGYEVTPGADIKLHETEITEDLFNQICKDIDTNKLVLKPTDNGSSIGLSQATNFEEFKAGIKEAGKYTNHVVIEKFIPHKEIVVGVIGYDSDITVSDLGLSNEALEKVYSYEEKYIENTPCISPAPLSNEMTAEIKRLTAEIYTLTKCTGWARVDFLIENGTDKIYLNEVNTMPGMSEPSVFPAVFKSAGYTYAEMVEKILDTSIAQHQK